MAQVTIELRNLLKINNFEVFDFDYPIISQAWKTSFEDKFINRFYFNEIGLETPDRWKHYLKSLLNERMPYYIKLHETISQVPNWLSLSTLERSLQGVEVLNVDGLENIINDVTGTVGSSSNLDTRRSEYPQTTNAFNDLPTEQIGEKRNSTDTNTAKSTQDSKINTDQTKDTTQSILETRSGDVLSFIVRYNSQIKDMDSMIIDECKKLFILVY